jgi:hypothetical protein
VYTRQVHVIYNANKGISNTKPGNTYVHPKHYNVIQLPTIAIPYAKPYVPVSLKIYVINVVHYVL